MQGNSIVTPVGPRTCFQLIHKLLRAANDFGVKFHRSLHVQYIPAAIAILLTKAAAKKYSPRTLR